MTEQHEIAAARLVQNRAFRAFVDALRDLHPSIEAGCEVEFEEDNTLTVVLRIPAEVFNGA